MVNAVWWISKKNQNHRALTLTTLTTTNTTTTNTTTTTTNTPTTTIIICLLIRLSHSIIFADQLKAKNQGDKVRKIRIKEKLKSSPSSSPELWSSFLLSSFSSSSGLLLATDRPCFDSPLAHRLSLSLLHKARQSVLPGNPLFCLFVFAFFWLLLCLFVYLHTFGFVCCEAQLRWLFSDTFFHSTAL